MLLNPFTLHTPTTIDEALRVLATQPDAKILAGGTFCINQLKLLKRKGGRTPAHIISLKKIARLREITRTGDAVTLGAMATMHDIVRAPVLTGNLSVLTDIAGGVATTPLRNMATLGGNITCRYTWTELPAAMIALDAMLHFSLPAGATESISAEDFFARAAKSTGLLTHVTIKRTDTTQACYYRVKRSTSVDIPLFAICIHAGAKNGSFTSVRVAVNPGTAFAIRDRTLEAFLTGTTIDTTTAHLAVDTITSDIYDKNADEYKRHIARVAVTDCVAALIKKI